MTSDTSSAELDNVFYVKEDPEISESTKQLFKQYSGIPEDDLVRHIRNIRDKAWAHLKYPCIGRYAFVNFGITNSDEYPHVLERLKEDQDASILDLACCFGQDVRKLVYDGVPPAKIRAVELDPVFIDLGYELFRDRARLQSTFKIGDFLGSNAIEDLGLEDNSFDFIQADAFFHLFNWDEQVFVVSRTVKLLKNRPGSFIFGRQIGVEEPGSVKYPVSYSGEMYRHSTESFKRLMEQVAVETHTSLKTTVKTVGDFKMDVSGEWLLIRFCITIE